MYGKQEQTYTADGWAGVNKINRIKNVMYARRIYTLGIAGGKPTASARTCNGKPDRLRKRKKNIRITYHGDSF